MSSNLALAFSELLFDHDLATMNSPSRHSHHCTNRTKPSSTCPALGRFGSESPTRMSLFIFDVVWLHIHKSPGRCLENPSHTTMSSISARLPPLPSSIPRTAIRLISQSPPSSKKRSCATGVKRCKRQAYLTDYVAQVSQFEPLPISAAPRQNNGHARLNFVTFS